MSTLIDLANFLDTAQASLTLGTNLFIGRLPDSPDTCVVLYEYGGSAPDSLMGTGLPAIQNPAVQVVVRSASYAAAETLATTCWTTLEGIVNQTLTATLYYRVSAIQSPFPLERDSQDRIVFVQNFDVQRVFA